MTTPSASPVIELTDAPPAETQRILLDGLMAHQAVVTGRPADNRPLALLLRDPESGAILGGLSGRTDKGWLIVQLFYLPESERGTGLGATLLARAEEEARARGCHHAWLDTFSFQAPGFYQKQGYQPFASLPDYPAGHTKHFLFKKL